LVEKDSGANSLAPIDRIVIRQAETQLVLGPKLKKIRQVENRISVQFQDSWRGKEYK